MTAANSGIRFLGYGAVLWLSSACMVHEAQPKASDLAAERARAARAEQQVTALEARLARLETQAAQKLQPLQTDPKTSDKLDRLIAAQERMVQNLERLQAPAVIPVPVPVPAPAPHGSPAAAPGSSRTSNAALSDYIQDLIERSESDAPPWRGGLSREKREALRVLLKPERTLDLGNPMEL
jgi:hypothetical protein